MNFITLLLIIFHFASTDIYEKWNTFEKNVRDQKITKAEAKTQFTDLYNQLKKGKNTDQISYSEKWIFPVKGANENDIGKGGFVPKGYNFYDGNKHGGHAAYDIFILDKNQDCLIDKTKQPADIIAPVDLIILSQNSGWKEGSEIRGGNYIWAYNPKEDLVFYFAHLNEIKVNNGTVCKAGLVLATLGRSGKNAFPKRSPTHLHFTVLKVKENNLIPYDYLKHIVKK